MADRCKHGMDARFCAACNRATSGAAALSLADVLAFLNAEKVRATYGAVGAAVGLNARSIGAYLDERRIEASWVVNADTGLPTGYAADQIHPDLLSNPHVIASGTELLLQVASWKARPRASA